MKFNVMFVDDSISVLESLQWLFMDEPYYLFAFDNPVDALSVIKSLEVAVVVVADQFIPKMEGLEFLKRVRSNSPHTMGIMMTDYDPISDALETLYPGCVYRFIQKPLDNNEIKQAVKTAISYYEIKAASKTHAVLR